MDAKVRTSGMPASCDSARQSQDSTFFCDADYAYYLELLAEFKADAGVNIWAYCVMPNHVHLVAVPERENSLAMLFREVHRRYSRYINFREQWKGHL